ncbi:MAG: hypothetical protein SCALA702_25540 [Melioribacteraceae bacterium]|nr:MAG: hypothetical protein SCALA702_25540 [Melioribacteraceae bacterium]
MLKYSVRVLTAMLLFSVAVFCGDTPKNIIFMVGDGMGVHYVSASVLTMEDDQFTRFTTSGLSVTCSADALITDSAAGATAFAIAKRTNNGMISMLPDKTILKTVLELAEEKGYLTGVISTSSITHATPACFYAHVESRKMEYEIAEFLVDSGVEVAIGGGTKFFLPEGKGGERNDAKNIVATMKEKGYEYFDNVKELKEYSGDKKILSLLASNGLEKAHDRDYTLGELSSKAINRLSNGENGFFLMIEGSQIDWAGHANDQEYAMGELEDFNTALKAVLDFAEKDGNTLVIVTADHETGGMSIVEGNLDGSGMEMAFGTGHHTPVLVPIFSYGPGSEKMTGIKQNTDIGEYLRSFYK